MTNKLWIVALGLAVSATASAGDSIHNADHVLGKSYQRVVSVCRDSGGTWDKDDGICAVPGASAIVLVAFVEGRASLHGLRWDGADQAPVLYAQAKRAMGDPDISRKDDGCMQHWWIIATHTFVLLDCQSYTGWMTEMSE